jgi:hypothetical protein
MSFRMTMNAFDDRVSVIVLADAEQSKLTSGVPLYYGMSEYPMVTSDDALVTSISSSGTANLIEYD